jgi:hypothetical protein
MCLSQGPEIDEELADHTFRTLKKAKNSGRGGKYKIYWTIRKQYENKGRPSLAQSMHVMMRVCA